MVILSPGAVSNANNIYNVSNYYPVTAQPPSNGQWAGGQGSGQTASDSLNAYSGLGQTGTFSRVNPYGTGSVPAGTSSGVLAELDAIAREIGDDSLIGIQRDASGKAIGIKLNYSPKRVGQILMKMAKNGNPTSIVGQMRRLLGLLEAGRYVGLSVYSVDESGNSTDTGILNSSSTVIGSTNQLIAPSTQGFNAFSRASEVLLAWLDVLSLDPTTIQSDTVDVAGTQISKADIQEVNDVLKANPEIPAALKQFANSLETLNKRQEANITAAGPLKDINAKLTQPNTGGGGGRQQAG